MQSFFTNPATHIAPEGQLHLWAMASPVIREALQPFARVCEPFPFLGLQPTADLHATVLRLGPADGDPSAFIDTFTREAGGLGALSIPLGWPIVTVDSVLCRGEHTEHWDALIAAAQRASIAAFGEDAAPYDPPFGPHVTVAYGVGEGSDTPVEEALARAKEDVLAQRRLVTGGETGGQMPGAGEEAPTCDPGDHLAMIDITSVVLARVCQDRQAGTYTAQILADVPLPS